MGIPCSATIRRESSYRCPPSTYHWPEVIRGESPIGTPDDSRRINRLRRACHVPRTIAFLNRKGGVGKTSTVHHLAGTLARRGLKILLVDVDGQASLTQG